MAWFLAGAALTAVVVTVALWEGGSSGGDPQGVPTAAETTVTDAPRPTAGTEATTAPSAVSSTTSDRPSITAVPPAVTTTTVDTSQPSTTSTTQPRETTTSSTWSASGQYTPTPKATTGSNTVAPGGALTKHLVADIARAFRFGVADVEAAIANVDLPPEARGNPEGWLAPGTYGLSESDGADVLVQAMVDRRVAQLQQRSIPRDQWHRVVTAASVIEKETYNQNEKPGVARVLVNRLNGGGPLQMDSIILYPVPEDRIFTTSAERASEQPYNSYKHTGLPPTPISSPDEASIDAFLAPPPGDWWFYVTIDLHSGETRYAVTYEDHLENVELLRVWLREHPTP